MEECIPGPVYTATDHMLIRIIRITSDTDWPSFYTTLSHSWQNNTACRITFARFSKMIKSGSDLIQLALVGSAYTATDHFLMHTTIDT